MQTDYYTSDIFYNPRNVVGKKILQYHVLFEAIRDLKASHQEHKTSEIGYSITLILPFVAKRNTSSRLFSNRPGPVKMTGSYILTHQWKCDSNVSTNFTRTLLLVFEEEESNFTADTSACEFTFDCEDDEDYSHSKMLYRRIAKQMCEPT